MFVTFQGEETYKVDLRFMAHVSDNLDVRIGGVRHINKRSTTVNVVSAETKDHSLDRVERALVEDQVSCQNMN